MYDTRPERERDRGRTDPSGRGGPERSAHSSSGTGRPIRVVVADDAWVIREAMRAILEQAPEVDLAEVCSNGKELERVIAELRPDVVMTDIRMPPSGAGEGIAIAGRLRESNPQTGVIVLSQYVEPSYALGLLENGTAGRAYLVKETLRSRNALIGAIQAVANGRSVIDPLVVDVLIQARSRAARSRLSELTAREREVLAEIATGKSNAAIADDLVLTKRAVEKHVNSIFAKLALPASEDTSRRVRAALLFLAEEDQDRPPGSGGPERTSRATVM